MNAWRTPGLPPLILSLCLLAACTPIRSPGMEFRRPGPAAGVGDDGAADADGVAATITAARVRRWLDALAGGRPERAGPSAAAADGADEVAESIASQFRRLGLQPASGTSGFRVLANRGRFSLVRDSVRLRFTSQGRGVALRYGADYVAVAGVGAVDARAVFLGGENGALNRVPAGAVPFVRLHEPPTDERGWEKTARVLSLAAARGGVPALVVVLGARFDASTLPGVAAALEAPADDATPVPVFFVRHQTAERVLQAAGVDADVLDADPSSPLPLKRLRVEAAAPARTVGAGPDVVALLPGGDAARSREYVVLGARYGWGRSGAAEAPRDAVAEKSGAAVLLEVAAAFARMDRPPARSVLFLAAAADPAPAGSRDLPTLPGGSARDVVAALDLGKVGAGPDAVVVLGHDGIGLRMLFERLAALYPGLRFTIRNHTAPGAVDFTRRGANRGVRPTPVAVITTTPRAAGRSSDGAPVADADRLARIARLAFLAAERLSRP